MQTINPHLLDVVKRESDYALYYSGRPLQTPSGRDVAHPDPRLLEHILRELSFSRVLDDRGINAYSLFCVKDDGYAKENAPSLDEIIRRDPIVRRKSHRPTGGAPGDNELLIDCIEAGRLIAFYFSGLASVLRSLNEFLVENGHGGMVSGGNVSDEFRDAIRGGFFALSSAKQAVILSLCAAHEAGIVLPLLLVHRRLTPSEYANALFSVHLPFEGNGKAETPCNDIIEPAFRKTPVKPDWTRPDESFSQLRDQASMAMEYLACYERTEHRVSGIRAAIGMGEHFGVEFKSCLRWNLKSGRKDPAIEHACLKTVAAFLNSSGGTLFIGVRDDGSIQGIEADGFEDNDRFALHFWNLVKSRVGQTTGPFIKTAFESLDGRTVFVVDCAASANPVFLNQPPDEDAFYIRLGPSSVKLTIREALKYIAQRFEKQHDEIAAG